LRQRDHLWSELGKLAKAMAAGDLFATDGQPDLSRLLNLAKRRRICLKAFFLRSTRCKSGRIYLVARTPHEEVLVCLEHSAFKEGSIGVFKNATRNVLYDDGGRLIVAYVLPFTDNNLRSLIDEALPEAGPRNLKSIPRLGLGVRMLFTLPHLLIALNRMKAVSDFQLSAGREFSLTDVVKSAPGKYPEWLGHTGLDALTLYGTIAKECFKSGSPVYGTEVDHLIVTDKPEEAISRIRRFSVDQSSTVSQMSESGLQESIEYNLRVIDEATGTEFVRGMTVDTSALLRYKFDDTAKWTGQILKAEFERQFSKDEMNALTNRYRPGERLKLKAAGGDETLELTYSEEDVMRLALKFMPSLAVSKKLFDHMSKAMKGKKFTFEPSLDETNRLTTPKELFFYLTESKQMGMPADLIAPNVGFRKREDYENNLGELRRRVRELSIVASNFGAILDFHSGSDKRPQVYRTISEACYGELKLKMSGVYQLLYFETLASFPRGTRERKLFERIWHYTFRYAKQKADEGDATAQRQVKQILRKMSRMRENHAKYKSSPKDDFFRYYSFIAVAGKRKNGQRLFRNSLYRLAQTNRVSERYAPKVIGLTTAVATSLGLKGGWPRPRAGE